MSQHDYVLENANGAEFRADINNALAAAVTLNSGATAPSTTYPFMFWADTATNVLKQRNAANTSWVPVGPLGVDYLGAVKTDLSQNFTAPQRSALLTDNDGNFDLSAKQNFKCTTAAGLTLTFTNQADGLSGSVYFINASNHAIAAHANTKLTTSDLTKLSATGTYRVDYLTDGTNALCSVVGPYA